MLSLSSTLEASFKNATLEQGQPLGFFEILQFFFSFLKFLINSQIGKIPYSSAKSRIFPESFNTRLYFILIYGVSCTLDLSPQVQYMMYRHLHRWLCCQDCLIVSIDLKKKKIIFCLLGEICQTLLSFCKFLNFIPSLILSPFLTLHATVPPSSCPSIYALLLSSEFQVEKC